MLEDILEEYDYYCISKRFTRKTLINKRQELKQFKRFMTEKRGIVELESITTHDIKAYMRYKQKSGLKPQSIVSMLKMIRAFFLGVKKRNVSKKI
nr:site-specific integrase [Geobacillus kaustophilus]